MVCCELFVVVCSSGGVPSFVRMTIFGGRLERKVGVENWSRMLEVMCVL